MIAPAVQQLANEMLGRVRVGKLNVDENPKTAERLAVRGIPFLMLLKDGRPVDSIVGVQPKAEIVRRVNQALAN